MKELRRLLDTDEVPPDVARLLRAGSATPAMPKGVPERARKRLAALSLPAAVSVVLGWKGLALAGALVVGGVSAHALVTGAEHEEHHPDPVASQTPAKPSTSVVTPFAGLASAILSPPDAPVESTTPSRSPVDTGRAAPTDTLASELALIGRGRNDLDSDPASALRALDEHARRFPNGKLTIERELLALDALDRLQRNKEARERAKRLLTRARGTIYEARVRAYLEHSP